MNNKQVTQAACFGLHWLLIPAIAVTMTLWPTVSSGLEQLQTDAGDTLLNLYFLEHAYQHFTGSTILNPDQYWSPNFFWPIKNTLAWSDHLLGPSVLYGAFRFLLDPYQSYVAWLSLTLTLNYLSIRMAAQRIAPTAAATWISMIALVTAFSPAIIQQLGHPQLLSLFLIGLILCLCHRLIHEPTEDFAISSWLSLASWLLAIGFFNIYICVYACYGTLICALTHLGRRLKIKNLIIKNGKNLTRNAFALASIIGTNLVIYWPYLQTLKTFGKRPGEEILTNLPKPLSYFYSSNFWLLQAPWSPDNPPPAMVYGAEQELFPGWIVLILLAAAIITSFRKSQTAKNGLRPWLWVIAAMVLFSLSWGGFSAWPLISKLLPGASSLRASSRVAMMIILFASPALALASQHWHHKLNQTKATLAGILAMTGSFAGIWAIGQPSFSLQQWKKELNALSSSLNNSECSVFWYQWSDQPPWRAQVLAMHAQRRTGIPTANGYSGHFPREQWPFTNPSGHNAFQWIERAGYRDHHETRELTNPKSWCVATRTADGDISLRDPADIVAITIKDVTNILYTNNEFSLGSKHRNLYLKADDQTNKSRWLLLTRDNNAIASDRGDYKITQISQPDPLESTVLITDRNVKQGIQYVWVVNSKTGEFLSQTMEAYPKP